MNAPLTDPTGDLAGYTKPSLTFWGAASAVSGSMHVLEANRQAILLDCGLYQGRREVARQRNSQFPFHPDQIDVAIVSHSHIDHCGNLPTLVRQGFSGPIYCTPPTRDLIRVMLLDSAKIQEEDAAHLNIARNYAEPLIEPLYTFADVERALQQVVPIPYGRVTDLGRDVRFHFLEAGHILGSAMVHIDMDGPDKTRSVTFSGDLGRRGLPLLHPTAPLPAADLLVCESTYGNRRHQPVQETVDQLYAAVSETISRGGKVLIPAFSLGRCQLIIHYLQVGLRDGLIPKVPVYVDSPLAADVADVYRKHPENLGPEVSQAVREGHGVLGGDGVRYVRSFQESIRLADENDPCVIIASSGMCDAGRILGHLKQHIDDPRSTVILVSYQAAGTLGRRLTEKRPTVQFLGREWNKWINVVHLEGFSGHADIDDFLNYLEPLAGQIQAIRLIHGEREQALALCDTLRNAGFSDVGVPTAGDRIVID